MSLFEERARLGIEGIALWSQRLPGWERARRILSGDEPAPETSTPRPSPALLPPNERRRAPDSVVIAIEAAQRACEAARRDPAALPCVFSSARGDLPITDYMCATLAATPLQISPTRFHNSVHNAAAGYWTIGVGCARAYTALCAGEHSFGAGLLEAATQALSGREPVLLVSYDIEAKGPLIAVAPSRHFLCFGLVLNPDSDRAIATLDVGLSPRDGLEVSTPRAPNAALVEGNASQAALPLAEALAVGGSHELIALAAPDLALRLGLRGG